MTNLYTSVWCCDGWTSSFSRVDNVGRWEIVPTQTRQFESRQRMHVSHQPGGSIGKQSHWLSGPLHANTHVVWSRSFIDASLSIRRTNQPGTYHLVVTRTYQEGEAQLLEDDAESQFAATDRIVVCLIKSESRLTLASIDSDSDERSFLLDSSLFLSLGPTLDPSAHEAPPLSFTWLDPDGDGPDDEFEFVLPADFAESGAEEFERLSWRCMWEKQEDREWPTDQREADQVEARLEDMFKVE